MVENKVWDKVTTTAMQQLLSLKFPLLSLSIDLFFVIRSGERSPRDKGRTLCRVVGTWVVPPSPFQNGKFCAKRTLPISILRVL